MKELKYIFLLISIFICFLLELNFGEKIVGLSQIEVENVKQFKRIQSSSAEKEYERIQQNCEPITIPLCQDMPYNETSLPNLLGHETQEEAGYEIHQYYVLAKINCSSSLKSFLCALFTPECSSEATSQNLQNIIPCRKICEKSRTECQEAMLNFGLGLWPDNLECSRFPECGKTYQKEQDKNFTLNFSDIDNNFTSFGNIKILTPPSLGTSSKNEAKELTCPLSWQVADRSIGSDIKDCAIPCSLFKPKDKELSAIIIISISSITIISSLFTIITGIIDSKRFSYPERALFHIALCYLGIGIAYLIGAILDSNNINCDEEGFIVSDTNNAPCTLLFMLVYFCTLSTYFWWFLHSLTWFLTTGLHWIREAIADYSLYYHIISWGIPAVLTIFLVAFGFVEGDLLAGPCSLGIQMSTQMIYFLLIPQLVLLFLGSLFFAIGFVALCRVSRKITNTSEIKTQEGVTSTEMKNLGQRSLLWDNTFDVSQAIIIRNGAERLKFLMIRIGILTFLFIATSLGNIVTIFYISNPTSEVVKPIFELQNTDNLFLVLIFRHATNLSFGCFLLIWISNRKTVKSWKNTFFVRRETRNK